MIPTLVVAGGSDASARATVAVNLAVAFSALGHEVEIVDRDPATPLLGALAGAATRPRDTVVLAAGARLGITLRSSGSVAAGLRVADAGPSLDEVTLDLIANASLVVVPLDSTPAARQALDGLAELLLERPGSLRVVLSRLLPRAADRWSLVEELDERYADALSAVTLPMGRRALAASGGRAVGATLFAPTGRAAKAYVAVARELARVLGLAEAREAV